jgi:hypothetical protein
MPKPMTAEELKNYQGPEGFTDKVKEEIELVIDNLIGPGIRADYLRGYLVQQCEDAEIDDEFIEDLGDSAAPWVDGWDFCEAWIRTCDDTTYCPEVGEEFDCYLVPKSQLGE